MTKKITFGLLALLLFALPAIAQNTLTQTTLSSAVSSTASDVCLAAYTGVTGPSTSVAGTTLLLMNSSTGSYEAVTVRGVTSYSAACFTVTRGRAPSAHISGAYVYYGAPNLFHSTDPVGGVGAACSTTVAWFNLSNKTHWTCKNSYWGVTSAVTDLTSVADNNPIQFNSRNYITTGSHIGFQAKPSQAVTITNELTGGEISPRLASGVGAQGIIGLHVDAYLKGTAAGAISGDVRGLNVELVSDDAGTRTIGGNVSAIRIRTAFSSGTITGKMVPIRIEVPETQTNSKTYDAVLELTGTISGVYDDSSTATGDTEAGFIKVLVNGNARYIQLFSDAPQ